MVTNSTNDTMRGLFFIVKGRYNKNIEPKVINRMTGDEMSVGCYDPEGEETENWYMVMDKKTYHCISCGSDFEKAVTSIYRTIVKHKGIAKNYFRYVCKYTSEDYYEVHYLGHEPLTPEKRAKKAEGRCPRTSPPMYGHYEQIKNYYGDYYIDLIQEQEDLAYQKLADDGNQYKQVQKRYKKLAKPKTVEEKPVEDKKPKLLKKKPQEKVVMKPTPAPKKKSGFKKLKMGGA